MKIGFERTDDNNNMYIKTKKGKGILLFKFFIDDIIFGGQDALCNLHTMFLLLILKNLLAILCKLLPLICHLEM